ncbi:MAG: hypothetical protein ACRC46_02880 [Thermoguttaceae bacterium]
MPRTSHQLDVTWKDAITEFLVPLLESVLPDLAAVRDTKRDIRFLDKELHELAITRKHGKRKRPQHLEVDVLVELPLCGVPDVWLLLHIEIQGRGSKKDVNLRMYEYHQMIEAKYHKPVVGLLIATEPLKTVTKLGKYEWRGFGTKIVYQFNVIKTYALDESKLLASENPFDLMLLSALRAWKARKSEREKLEYAKGFVQLLRQRQFDENVIARLVVFMEYITRMHEDTTEIEYATYVDELDKKGETPMQMLIVEKHALKRGRLEGREEGKLEGKLETAAILKQLGVELENIVKATGLTRAQVESLAPPQTQPSTDLSK